MFRLLSMYVSLPVATGQATRPADLSLVSGYMVIFVRLSIFSSLNCLWDNTLRSVHLSSWVVEHDAMCVRAYMTAM